MNIEEIQRLSFEDFRNRFSQEEQNDRRLYPSTFKLFTSNEFTVTVSRQIQGIGGIYVGIIGGVDQVLNHLAHSNSELAVLFDLNKASIDYLQIRLEVLRAADSREQYLAEILNFQEMPFQPFQSKQMNYKIFANKTVESMRSPLLTELKRLFTHEEFDNEKRLRNFLEGNPMQMLKCFKDVGKFLEENNESCYLLDDQLFSKVKAIAEGDRIKAFYGNAFTYAIGKSFELVGESLEKQLIVYISNAFDYTLISEQQAFCETITKMPENTIIIGNENNVIVMAGDWKELATANPIRDYQRMKLLI